MLISFKRRSIPAIKIFFGIAIAAFFISCSGARSANGPRGNGNTNTAAEPTIQITVAKTESRNVPAYIQATGSLVADETSDIAPKVAGKIKNVEANVGQFVTQGSVIAEIDDKDARLQLASAQANVKQATAGVRQAEARLGLSPNGTFNASTIPEVKAANANYQQLLAELRQAEANEQRYRALVETGDVASITYETYRTTRDTARAKVNSAKEQLDAAVNTAKQSNQAIASAQAAVEAAQTQVGTAQKALADTVIQGSVLRIYQQSSGSGRRICFVGVDSRDDPAYESDKGCRSKSPKRMSRR